MMLQLDKFLSENLSIHWWYSDEDLIEKLTLYIAQGLAEYRFKCLSGISKRSHLSEKFCPAHPAFWIKGVSEIVVQPERRWILTRKVSWKYRMKFFYTGLYFPENRCWKHNLQLHFRKLWNSLRFTAKPLILLHVQYITFSFTCT